MASDQQMTVTRTAKALAPAIMSKTTRQVVPAFLQKLYEMVNDPKNSDLIRWSDAGDSFFVLDHERFAHDVLGRWFKHRNFSSFVRQLNMYGFHKIPHLQQGVLKSDTETEFWNFAHPNFHRGQPDLLCLIQRKKTSNQPATEDIEIGESTPQAAASNQSLDVQSVVQGIAAIKRHQTAISSELNELKRSNQLLWQDAMTARQKHQKQQDTINRIVKFLAGVFGTAVRTKDNPNEPVVVIPRRSGRLMIEDTDRDDKNIIELDDMLTDDMATPISITSLDDITTAPSPQPSAPSPQSTATPTLQAETPQPTAPQPQPSANEGERAVTPRQSPSTPNVDFDPRSTNFLNQLTPAQLQLLLNSLAANPLPDPNSIPASGPSELPNPTSAPSPSTPSTSHLTPYQPPMEYNFFPFPTTNTLDHNIPLYPGSPSPVPAEGLISFGLGDGFPQERAELQWQQTKDIDRDVNALNTSIQNLIQTFGLDPNLLAEAASHAPPAPSTSNHPSSSTLPSLAPTSSDIPNLDDHSTSSLLHDLGPLSSTADFDFDSFFQALPAAPEGADMDYGDLASSAFLDEVPSPANSVSPIQNLRHLSPEVTSSANTSPAALKNGLNVPPLLSSASVGTGAGGGGMEGILNFGTSVHDGPDSATLPPSSIGKKRKSDVSDLDIERMPQQFQSVTPAELPASSGSTSVKPKRRKEK
ncbi:hypothetical protein FA15DRAFT_621656 [Coprinopsis marcescibilis]|uniref:HSF-type DNA-binding domain-containing protein n=1 Tax=Coprinopsis marcescibilis TaxID=230819 RepID=A0A5C3KQW5_COPMA|nr:hypothetical protein FA15DRAFT_621656 [Coprinopsis marcescibilis]